jgi:hypothetical protein
MMPMSLERMTETGIAGSFARSASAARNPALPPPRMMMRLIFLPSV